MFGFLKKVWPWILLVILPCIIMLPLMMTHQFHYRVDMWFHMMRIQEMNGYFHSLSWPGMGNIYSFGQSGQLIQGMYPSLTLAILVGLTSFLSAINQIYAIIILIVIAISGSFFWFFKKLMNNDVIALLSAIIISYPTAFICGLERGQFGLVVSMIFLPMIFWGLYQLQQPNNKTGAMYVGLGVGLTWLTHISSGIFIVILVMVMGTVDLLLKRKNLGQYIISGVLSGLIALPTLLKLVVYKNEVMPVVEHGLEAKLNLLNVFDPLWLGTRYYHDFMSALAVIALIYVIFTVKNQTQFKSMKVTVLILTLMSTTAGYFIFLRPLQFPTRFLAYALPLAMFIMLLEIPDRMKKWQPENRKIVYVLLVFLAMVPAINSPLRVRDFVKTHELWQVNKLYLSDTTTVDKESLQDTKFTSGRTYIDYMPKQQKKTAEKGGVAYVGSKAMRDVNEAKSVRLSGFNPDEIQMKNPNAPKHLNDKLAAENYVIPVNPATNLQAHKRTLTMTVNVPASGQYDLPFWMYAHVNYDVKINNVHVTPKISDQGRMSVPLNAGKQTVTITQKFPIMILGSYMVMSISIICALIYLRKKRTV